MSLFSIFKRREPADEVTYRIPAGTRVYAIGDIHGQLHLLTKLRAMIDNDIAADAPERIIEVYLGDYVDRGEQAAGVIDAMLEPVPAGRERIFIRGNHESYLAEFATAEANEVSRLLDDWLPLGGVQTLASYGVTVPRHGVDARDIQNRLWDSLPERHLDFIDDVCRPSCQIGEYFFTHAGVRPGTPLDAQDEDDLMLIRDEFLSFRGLFPARIVHGHTIVREAEIRPNRINVDTGAFASGRLSCAVLEGADVRILATR